MGWRPPDWEPLAPSDPVPGDPEGISDEAARLTQVADSIRDQVTALRRVADAAQNGSLQGQYVGKISDTARSLADHLGKAEGRYRTASGELKLWTAALETAQRDSLTQRDHAKQAQTDIEANTVSTPPHNGSPSGAGQQPVPAPTPAQQSALADAQHRLSDAHAALTRITGTLKSEASARASAIKAACQHDGLKDSTWDKFKHWIDDHKVLLTDICNALGWLATICAVVALFIPGLNILALIAIGATALSLLGHTALAAAGDGSWFDVALDVFALATMGMGKLAGSGAKAAEGTVQAGVKGQAAVRAGTKAFDRVMASDPEIVGAYKAVDDPALSLSEKAANWLKIGGKAPEANAARDAARQRVLDLARTAEDVPKFELPNLGTLAHGERGAAATRAWGRNVARVMADDPHIAGKAAQLDQHLARLGASWKLGAGVDAVDKTFGSALNRWHADGGYWNFTRDPFYMPIGGTW